MRFLHHMLRRFHRAFYVMLRRFVFLFKARRPHTAGGDVLHLGTREIQLVLLKACLLVGVKFSYGTELAALQVSHSGVDA